MTGTNEKHFAQKCQKDMRLWLSSIAHTGCVNNAFRGFSRGLYLVRIITWETDEHCGQLKLLVEFMKIKPHEDKENDHYAKKKLAQKVRALMTEIYKNIQFETIDPIFFFGLH